MVELVLVNGNVRTMDAEGTIATAVAVRGDRVAAVGGDGQVLAAGGPAAAVVDLAGRWVIPGLIDAHTHLEGTAVHLSRFADCHVPPHDDIPGILAALADHAARNPDVPWVIGQGSFMLREKLREGRLPTLAEVDSAVPDRPALIRAGAHISVVNTRALEVIGVTGDFVPPSGAHVERDSAGRPTGVLIEMYWHLGLPPFSMEETREAVAGAAAQLSSYGVTSVQDQFPSANGLRAYQQLRREGRFPLRISFTVHCPTVASLDPFLRLGMETGFGDEHLKVGAVKFFVDGGITGAAGAFHDDYAHEPGNRGHLKLSSEDTFAMVRRIDDAGLQISTHVVGDRALDMLLDAYEAHPATWGKRHRLEHAGHLCMTPERIDRIKGMGLVPVVTMPFLSSFGDFLPVYLGERADGAFALRRMLDAGLPVAGSSDSLGAQPESLNPWFGMWCSVARRTYRGALLSPEEAVTPLEALRTYTTHAAHADFEEHRTGSLAPGMLADLVVLDRDPASLTADELLAITPIATILGGEVVSGTL